MENKEPEKSTDENVEPKVFLTQAQIFAADDLELKDVYIEKWKGWVRLRTLTGKQRDRFEASVFSGKGSKGNMNNLRARLVALSVVDEDGKPMFSINDAEKLGKKSASVLDHLFEEAQKLSGLRKEDVEELEKNLETDPDELSASD